MSGELSDTVAEERDLRVLAGSERLERLAIVTSILNEHALEMTPSGERRSNRQRELDP